MSVPVFFFFVHSVVWPLVLRYCFCHVYPIFILFSFFFFWALSVNYHLPFRLTSILCKRPTRTIAFTSVYESLSLSRNLCAYTCVSIMWFYFNYVYVSASVIFFITSFFWSHLSASNYFCFILSFIVSAWVNYTFCCCTAATLFVWPQA